MHPQAMVMIPMMNADSKVQIIPQTALEYVKALKKLTNKQNYPIKCPSEGLS